MKYPEMSYRIFPLGDAALTVEWGHCIDEEINKEVLARFAQLRSDPLPGMTEVSPAYNSLAIFYDVPAVKKLTPAGTSAFEWMQKQVEQFVRSAPAISTKNPRLIKVPICYDKQFAPDLAGLATKNKLTIEEVIEIHLSVTYRVYMLGFLPGFTYMGQTDERIAMDRKLQPTPVSAGSVGIAGRQTGIYPLASPGGWHVIGRTPLRLFDASREEPVLLQAGDNVQFFSIDRHEFENY